MSDDARRGAIDDRVAPPFCDTTAGASEVSLDGGTRATPVGYSGRIGRYLLEGVLGAGGMGVVYVARDPSLGRAVALKLIRPGADERSALRLLREAQAIARVSHPNVIHVYDVGRDPDGGVYIAMERVEGPTLERWLEARSRSPGEIVDAFAAAGLGLAAAHAAGLVHRDFKPENVIVSVDGRIRVLDFGLARAADDAELGVLDRDSASELAALTTTAAGAVIGTPAYMSPEQWRGDRADARSDQFSFCTALYRALTGRHPFDATSRASLRATVLAGRLGPMPPSVPVRLRGALRRGLALRPEDRFPDMTALVTALSMRRRPRRVVAVVAVVAAIGAAMAIGALRAEHPMPDLQVPARPIIATKTYRPPRRITARGDIVRSSLSPDDRRVAFIGGRALMIQDLAPGGEARVLVRGAVAPHALAWSPDGARLAVVMTGESGDRPPRLVLVEAATGAMHHVSEDRGMVALLPHDELVTAQLSSKELRFYSLSDPNRPLRRCPLPGPITMLRGLRYHPATGAIFVLRDNSYRTTRLFRIDPECTSVAPMTPDMEIRWYALRSDAAGILIYQSYDLKLIEIGRSGGLPEIRHSLEGEDVLAIGVRRDGSLVHHRQVSDWRLSERMPDGSSRELIWGTGLTSFEVSPDETLLARVDDVYRGGTLHLQRLQGGESAGEIIASHVENVAWSPAGERLAMVIERPDGYDLGVFDLRKHAMVWRRDAGSPFGECKVIWLDPHRVATCATDDQWYRWFDIDTGRSGEVAAPAGIEAGQPVPSHHGVLAFLGKDHAGSGVWIQRPGEAPTLLARHPLFVEIPSMRHRLTWSPDGSSLHVYSSDGTLWRVAVPEGSIELVRRMPQASSGWSVSYDVFPLRTRTLVLVSRWSQDIYVSDPDP